MTLRNVRRRCRECGQPFAPAKGRRYCSVECRRSAENRAARERTATLVASGRCRQCGRKRERAGVSWCDRCLRKQSQVQAKWKHTPEGWAWWSVYMARRRAERLRVPFNLVPSDLMPLPRRCPVLGLLLDYSRKQRAGASENSPSLDRIVDEIGYVPRNVEIISYRANRLKNDGTLAERRAVVAYLRRMAAKVAVTGSSSRPRTRS